jgi:hypothetical protein
MDYFDGTIQGSVDTSSKYEEIKVSNKWVIEGILEDGRRFRPSDWVDRLSASLASFGPDHRLKYGPVRPGFVKGQKCLLVDKVLESQDPAAFNFVHNFARANGLRISDLDAIGGGLESAA